MRGPAYTLRDIDHLISIARSHGEAIGIYVEPSWR